jgi:hypothetical protein
MADTWRFLVDKDALWRWERVNDKGAKRVSEKRFRTVNQCEKDARANGWVWAFPPKTKILRRDDP